MPFFQENSIPKLDEIYKAWCDNNITIHDLSKALSELKNDKSPGSDGFSANLYKSFWE